LLYLKRKVESGVDVILTQVVFSADKFIEFVNRCRKIGISSDIPIIPGLYIPHNFDELNLMLKITKVSMDSTAYEKFRSLKDDCEGFKDFSLSFMTKMIHDIQENSQEFIKGFHFFTLNNFEMVQRLINVIDFKEE
jgi:methylenetetrahydrofolate reductase (NADPH)